MAVLLQFAPQFRMIVNFAVKDDDGVAIGRLKGLCAGFKINDFQPGDCHRDRIGLEYALLVRPAVQDGGYRGPNPRRVRPALQMRKSSNAAQDSNLTDCPGTRLVRKG
jgi:hypothetical protein